MLETGHQVTSKPEILFARIDVDAFQKTLEEEQKQEKSKKQGKSEITFDDFHQMELKVGTILSCEKHPKADRLLVEKIDLGDGDIRQIVSGIATHYQPKELVGRKVVVVANLKPANLRGVESEGMILCAGDDTELDLVTITKDMANGTIVS